MLLLSRAIMTKFERRWNFLTLLIRKKNVDKSAHLIALTMKLCEKLCFYLEDFKPVNYGIMNDRSWLKPQWFQCVKHAISGSGNGRIWECIQKEFKYKGQFDIFLFPISVLYLYVYRRCVQSMLSDYFTWISTITEYLYTWFIWIYLSDSLGYFH